LTEKKTKKNVLTISKIIVKIYSKQLNIHNEKGKIAEKQ